MKKMIACFLLCALVLAPVTAGAAESDWDMSVPTEITEEIQELFNDSVEKIVGAGYTPVAVLGVCDDTYCFLCKVKGVYPNAKPYNALVYIDGREREVANIYDLWLDAHSTKENGKAENVLNEVNPEIILDPIAAEDVYETADSVVMPMDSLRVTEEVTPEDISHTMGYIEKTKKGEIKKREPFSVVERGDGTYSIIDGNISYSALKELGAKNVPVIVADRPYLKDVKTFDDLVSVYSEAESEFRQFVALLGEELKAEISEHSDLKDADAIRKKAEENFDGDYGKIVDVLSADMRVPEKELQTAAQMLLEKDDVLCLYNHENDNGYTAYIRLSNGAIAEIQLFVLALGSSAPASQRPEDDLTVMLPMNQYERIGSAEVRGRQGVCCEGEYYWVSGSATLAKYDRDWNMIMLNDDPFVGYEGKVNHIADIDVYQNELYIGAEYFMDGVGENIQIAVYDGDTLELKRTFSFEPESGQLECSGIAVDPDTKTMWMCSWVGEESGRYLYKYDLETGEYLGKVHMQMPPQWLQGIAYHDGCFYMTADDGDADDDEPDHLYRTRIEDGATNCTVTLERTFDDVTRQGEIEGLTFDEENDQLLVLYNRGARIILGMPSGFYDGYDREISEVLSYGMST